VLAYVALSWLVRFDTGVDHQNASLVYPLDTFSMYAGKAGDASSALLVRDGQGNVRRVTSFSAFACREPVPHASAPPPCPGGIPYRYDDLVRYVETHAGPGERDAELVMRTWQLRGGGAPPPPSDCVIAHCTVSP